MRGRLSVLGYSEAELKSEIRSQLEMFGGQNLPAERWGSLLRGGWNLDDHESQDPTLTHYLEKQGHQSRRLGLGVDLHDGTKILTKTVLDLAWPGQPHDGELRQTWWVVGLMAVRYVELLIVGDYLERWKRDGGVDGGERLWWRGKKGGDEIGGKKTNSRSSCQASHVSMAYASPFTCRPLFACPR